MSDRKTHDQLADLAEAASKRGAFAEAAKLYVEAAGACLGAKRGERYQQSADLCLRMDAELRAKRVAADVVKVCFPTQDIDLLEEVLRVAQVNSMRGGDNRPRADGQPVRSIRLTLLLELVQKARFAQL